MTKERTSRSFHASIKKFNATFLNIIMYHVLLVYVINKVNPPFSHKTYNNTHSQVMDYDMVRLESLVNHPHFLFLRAHFDD